MLKHAAELALLAGEPKDYRELSRGQVCVRTWCRPGYADGRLYLRDAMTLRCVQLLP